MFGRIGPFELLLILAIVLVIFGPKKLPAIGSAIGKAIRELKESFGKKEDKAKLDDDERDEPPR